MFPTFEEFVLENRYRKESGEVWLALYKLTRDTYEKYGESGIPEGSIVLCIQNHQTLGIGLEKRILYRFDGPSEKENHFRISRLEYLFRDPPSDFSWKVRLRFVDIEKSEWWKYIVLFDPRDMEIYRILFELPSENQEYI